MLAFTASGQLLFVESEGNFDMKQWQEVAKVGSYACVGQSSTETGKLEDSIVQEREGFSSLGSRLRRAVEAKISQDSKWKQGIK